MYELRLSELIKSAQGERTQNEFALHCGIDSATLTKLLKGGRSPKPDTLKKIAARAHNGVTYEMLMIAAGYMDYDGENQSAINESDEPDIFKDDRLSLVFANRLMKLREEKKLTQKDFAKMISVSPSTVAMWEANKREPNFETVKNLAEFFEVSTDYLLGKTKTPMDTSGIQASIENGPFKDFDKLPKEDQEKVLEYYQLMISKHQKKNGE